MASRLASLAIVSALAFVSNPSAAYEVCHATARVTAEQASFTSSAGLVPYAGAAAGGEGDRSGVDRSTLPGASPASLGTLRTLLRAVVAEATWLERDHRAILHVLGRRAVRAGIAVDEMARMYISAFKRPPARAWVLELEPTCEQPPSWPESLDWETWKPQCELTVERIEAFLDGDSIDPCKGRAMHFGAPDLAPDLANAANAGWRVVNCGGTASRFYADRGRVISAQDARGSR